MIFSKWWLCGQTLLVFFLSLSACLNNREEYLSNSFQITLNSNLIHQNYILSSWPGLLHGGLYFQNTLAWPSLHLLNESSLVILKVRKLYSGIIDFSNSRFCTSCGKYFLDSYNLRNLDNMVT